MLQLGLRGWNRHLAGGVVTNLRGISVHFVTSQRDFQDCIIQHTLKSHWRNGLRIHCCIVTDCILVSVFQKTTLHSLSQHLSQLPRLTPSCLMGPPSPHPLLTPSSSSRGRFRGSSRSRSFTLLHLGRAKAGGQTTVGLVPVLLLRHLSQLSASWLLQFQAPLQ